MGRNKRNDLLIVGIIFLAIVLIGLGIMLFKKIYNGKKDNTTTTTETTTVRVIEQVTLSFDSNGGDKVLDTVVVKGEKASLPIASRKGYVFVKWIDEEGKDVTDSTTFDKDTKLKAVWKKSKKTYDSLKVSYNTNGGTKLKTKTYTCTKKLKESYIKYKERFSNNNYTKHYCPECGKEVSKEGNKCPECAAKNS